MKKLVEDGLESLIGERVTFYCMNFFYTGKLIGISSTYALLTDASIVYDTGSFDKQEWADSQKLPHDWYIQLSAVESFGILK